MTLELVWKRLRVASHFFWSQLILDAMRNLEVV